MLPSTNITTTMVGNELGISSRDIGTLCTSQRINRYSKYKPIKAPGFLDRNSDWGKGPDRNYSLNVPKFKLTDNTFTEFITYIRPTGGENSPYRLGDFTKYKHDARKPFEIKFPEYIIFGKEDEKALVTLTKTEITDGQISFEDIYGSDAFFGVRVKTSHPNTYSFITAESVDGVYTIDIQQCPTLMIRDEYAFVECFVSSVKIPQWESYPTNVDIKSVGLEGMPSVKMVPIKTYIWDIYNIDYNLGNGSENGSIAMDVGNAAGDNNGVSKGGTVLYRIENSYNIVSLQVRIVKYENENSYVFYDKTTMRPKGITPDVINATTLPVNQRFKFNSPLYQPELPRENLDVYYKIDYKFNYMNT